jgi:putative hemolysin
MKKLLICAIALLCTVSFVSAAETGLDTPDPTLLPDSPFYFLKDVGRNVQMFFTFDPVKKAELRMDFTNQKLAEANKLVDNNPNNENAITKALESYKKEIQKLKDYADTLNKNNPNNETLLNEITTNNIIHQNVLESIESKLTNKDKAQEVKDQSLEILTNTSFEVGSPEDVKDNIEQSMQSQGMTEAEKVEMLKSMEEIVPEESNKIIMLQLQETIINQGISNQSLSAEDKEKIQVFAQELTQNSVYQKMIVEDFAKKIISENQGTFDQLKNLPTEDTQKLNDLAQSILSGDEINLENTLMQFNSLDLSSDSKKILSDIQSQLINKINVDDIVCIQVVNPVCGIDETTYNNSCEASKKGVEIEYTGKCGECVKEDQKIVSSKQKCCTGLTFCAVSATGTSNSGTCEKVCEDKNTNSATPSSTGGGTSSSVGVANPASVYCKDQGYTPQIIKNSDGSEYGVCVFTDGTACDEWKFYKGECGASLRK